MKQKVIGAVCDILLFFSNHWVIVAAAITLTGIFGFENPYLALWMSLLGLPVYLYVVRIKVQRFYLFFFLQLLPFVVSCNVRAEFGIKLILLIIVIFYTVCSIKVRLSEIQGEIEFLPVISVGVIGVSFIVEKRFVGQGWGAYYLLAISMYLAGYFFYYFTSRYLNFVALNKNSAANIPERAIWTLGIRQTGLFVAGSIGILLLTANIEWLSYFTGLVGKVFVWCIRLLASFFPLEQSETNPMPSEQGVVGGISGFLEGGETHPFWIMLEKAATILFFVAAAVLLVRAFIKGYQFLWNHFRKIPKGTLQTEQGNSDIRENCGTEQRERNASKWFLWRNHAGKIRKLYRQYVLSHKNSIVGGDKAEALSYLTAGECCNKISAEDLRMYYEKARYSNERVSAEDVKDARSKIKRKG